VIGWTIDHNYKTSIIEQAIETAALRQAHEEFVE
jgi:hypothetical protein